MEATNRGVRIASLVIVAAGVLFLGLNIILEGKIDFTLPLIFLTLGPAFIMLAFALRDRWQYAPIFFIPGGLLSAFGIIFLLNVLTNDWNAWSYAWLLLLTGAGIGTALAAIQIPLRKEFLFGGLWTAVGSITLFGVFGAIAGGWVIRIFAPLLLLCAGLALRFWHSGWLSTLLFRGEKPEQTAVAIKAESDHSRDSHNQALPEPLSEREIEVLHLITQGLNNQEIAERLTVAPSTVKTHINNIYGKLGVQTRAQCIVKAQEIKLV